MSNSKGTIRKIQTLLEIIILTLSYYLVWKLFYRETSFPYYGRGKFILAAIYFILTLAFFYMCESYRFGYLKLTETLISQWISIFIVDVVTYFQLCLIANVLINPLPIILLFGIDLLISLVSTFTFTRIYHKNFAPKRMVMVYGNDNAVSLKFKMDERADKYIVEKIINIDQGLEAICREIDSYDAVIINDVPASIRNDILKYCYGNSIKAYLVPKISDVIIRGADEITLFDTPLLSVEGKGLSPSEELSKRILDLTLCLIAMIPGSVIMLLVALAIKLGDGGPVFFRQSRITKDGKKFDILKFRSMVVDAENVEKYKNFKATDGDPRITKVGKFIRATRLDELPQILNIIKGDMSIVGPRPERWENVEEYTALIEEFPYRNKVKGGLTGYAQIYGKYNTSAYDKLRLDLKYIEDYSLFLDIKLIFMTLQIMVRPEATEGFDKAEELEKKKQELLADQEKVS